MTYKEPKVEEYWPAVGYPNGRRCIYCGKEFELRPYHPAQQYCSKVCRYRAATKRRSILRHLQWSERPHIKCEYCGRDRPQKMHGGPSPQRYCSKICGEKAAGRKRLLTRHLRWSQKSPIKCGHCGKDFVPHIHGGGSAQQYCSIRCRKNSRSMKWIEKGKENMTVAYVHRLEYLKNKNARDREQHILEGKCAHCGRDNDRAMIGLLRCTNCAIASD